jgi:hypothetical protein
VANTILFNQKLHAAAYESGRWMREGKVLSRYPAMLCSMLTFR